MSKSNPPPEPEGAEIINLREALEERYLAYALSTIMHRALPDLRDGLKPVHRRLLYAMRQLKLDPGSGFKKCARVVGDVIGKFHPHGDQAVYDALVRLAQDFSQRYPLIEGQGNFGNVDGDNAAAMRYTESRLTDVAHDLLANIDEDAVDFRETYDGEEKEPMVLPGAFPNLLANGATGIAVGMATNIPPHNAGELCAAALHLIKYPNAGVEKLVDFVQGPDFPTGGVLVEPRASIVEAYKTGRGGFRLRARWNKEDLGRGGYQIVITEIPYQVQKAKLVEKIAELMLAKRLPLLADVLDESAEDIRLVIEPKSRSVDADLLMEQLFKLTDLEIRFGLNMNVLTASQKPQVLSLRDVLSQWLDHRKQVLVRRSNYRLEKIDHRLEVLEGYLIAYLNLDEIIHIIREEDDAKQIIMAKFKLSDVQAEAILNMRLRSLRRLEEIEIKTEHEKLKSEKADLKKLLKDDKAQWAVISDEIKQTKKAYSTGALGARRTKFGEAPDVGDLDLAQAMIEKEPITVVCSQKGWVRAMKGHMEDFSALSFKEDDAHKFAFHAETTDKLLLFATNGKFYTIAADKLPGGRGAGEPVKLMLDLDQAEDIISFFVHDSARKLLLASSAGNGFVAAETDLIANTRKGKQVLNVKAPIEAVVCAPIEEGADTLAAIGDNRKLVLFPLDDLPEMGRGKGVRLQKYKDGGLSDAIAFNLKEGLSWRDSSGRNWNVTELRDWVGLRAQAGRLPPKGFPRNNKFGL